MAVKWSWAWGRETAALMLSDMNFVPSDTSPARIDTSNTAADIYSYTGSPSRYSLRLDENQSVTMPTEVCGLSGWLACPFKMDNVSTLGGLSPTTGQLWVGEGAVGTFLQMASSGGEVVNSAIKLYVAGNYKATSATVFAWNAVWNYVALKFDCTANPWTASVWVNGVEEITVQSQAQAAATSLVARVKSGSRFDRDWKVGQVIIYDNVADAGQTARFCTRIEPTADLSEVGTWTQSVGTDNFAVVEGPVDVSTYTTEATAASGENFVCTSGVLSTILGITPTAIDGVTAHDWSTGAGITVFASVGESTGPTYTDGAAVTPLVSTTYGFATAPTNPAGGAWLAGNTVVVKHQVT